MNHFKHLCAVFCVFALYTCANGMANDIQTTVEELFKKIESMQAKVTTLPFPPIIWGKIAGSYESDVKQYFHGSPTDAAMRYLFGVYDNNMFATAWITAILLEAYRFGTAPKPTENQISLAIDFIMDHRNQNLNYSNSIMAFWPQIYNEKYQGYVSTPINLLALFNSTYDVDWNDVYKELEKLGLKKIEDTIKHLLGSREGYKHAFMIPPDFDDTSVNLGLGSLLKDMILDFPQSNALWQSRNTNLSSIFNALKHFAYRPMSGNDRVDTIDTRTYFYMRKFLETSQKSGKDVALISTWVQDLETVRYEYYKGVDTPGNVNNVDITVCANAIYGITNAILSGLVTSEVLEDKDIQQLYLNTSTMIAFQINTNFSSRPDLALTYYPSVLEFYWFVARTFSQLERSNQNGGLPHKAMEMVMGTLGAALRGKMTDVVLKEAMTGENGTLYYDDFLGNGDVDEDGKAVKYGEDRLFTTAMATNALITTWTYFDEKSRTLHWDSSTSEAIKTTVKAAVSFLNEFILTDVYKPWNAFFSGSFKGHGTSWSEYPANRYEYFNGTKIDEKHRAYGPTIRGMKGVANESWYEQEIKTAHFGRYTPVDFHGFNNDPSFFPFWSSEPYTYVTSMLALSTYNNIV